MKIVICQEEQYWIDTLKTAIAKWSSVRNIKCATTYFLSPQEMITYFTTHLDIDVLFLDISLGNQEIDGVILAKHIRKMGITVPIIFVSVDSYRAVDGYLVEAMGFLSKPIDENRFSLFLDRIVKKQRSKKAIKITVGGHIRNIFQDDIIYAEIHDHTVMYHTTQECLKFRSTLKEVLSTLDSAFFMRTHRSYIIRLDKIQSIKTTYPYSVNLHLDNEIVRLPLSRSYIDELLEVYSGDILGEMI